MFDAVLQTHSVPEAPRQRLSCFGGVDFQLFFLSFKFKEKSSSTRPFQTPIYDFEMYLI